MDICMVGWIVGLKNGWIIVRSDNEWTDAHMSSRWFLLQSLNDSVSRSFLYLQGVVQPFCCVCMYTDVGFCNVLRMLFCLLSVSWLVHCRRYVVEVRGEFWSGAAEARSSSLLLLLLVFFCTSSFGC